LCRFCDGVCAPGLVDGSRVIRRHGWNSAGLYRAGRRRLKPSVRCSEPECIGARHNAGASPHALQSVGAAFDAAEHGPMPDDPDRCPDDQRSADDVRIAFGRPSPRRGGDALPMTNLEACDVRAGSCATRNRGCVMKWQPERGSMSAAIATAATRQPSLRTPKVSLRVSPVGSQAACRA
jgi:hypothetical protein